MLLKNGNTIFKGKTPTWFYRDFIILAYFGEKVSNTQNGVDINPLFLLAQEGDSFD